MNEEPSGFAKFGTEFQGKLLQALFTDHRWAQQVSEVIDLEYFEKKHLKFLAQRFFDYYTKHKCFPSFDALVMIAREDLKTGSDQVLCERVVELLKRLKANPDPGDLPYVKEKALEFCRVQAMKEALDVSVDLIGSGRYEQVIDTMRKAIAVGTMPSVGHMFFDELDARLTHVNRNCSPTGIPELDAQGILNGGLGKGELGVVCASTGTGKSHLLIQFGANAIAQGKNVVHYTFELSEEYTGIRYDSYFCDIPSDSVIDSKEKVKLKYKEGLKGRGKLDIKYYPANTCSVMTMRNHLEKLEVTKGWKPDIIIVDYADIMRSSRSFESLRHELKLVYEELRALVGELNIPCWTASQANRDSVKSELVGLENMSEAYAKAMVADFVLSLSRKPLEKSTGVGRMFIAKNRMGRDGIVFPIKIDTSRSRIAVTDEPQPLQDEQESDKDTIKTALRQKLQEVEQDRELNVRRV